MSLTIRARALMTIGLIIVVDSTNFFKPTHFQWSKGLYPSTGPLDYQHGLSLEDCVSLCWEEDGCKSLNYHRHATLCELNRVDNASSLPTDLKDDTMSIYSEKISWTEVCIYMNEPLDKKPCFPGTSRAVQPQKMA